VQQPAPAPKAVTYNSYTHYAKKDYVYEEPTNYNAYWAMQHEVVARFNQQARSLGLHW
jgi:hypothetical protein